MMDSKEMATRLSNEEMIKYKEECVKRWENKKMDSRFLEKTADDATASREAVNKENIKESVIKSAQAKENRDKAKASFNGILCEMEKLHNQKNADYGNAFHEDFMDFGAMSGIMRLSEKYSKTTF